MIDFKKVLADLELDIIGENIRRDLEYEDVLVADGIQIRPLIYNPQVIDTTDYRWVYD